MAPDRWNVRSRRSGRNCTGYRSSDVGVIVLTVAGKRRNDAIAEQSQSERDEHDAQELRRAGIKVPKD